MPSTFNTDRYLGQLSDIQKDFHYLEKFRVDKLKQSSGHSIAFTLKEPTLVRIVSTVHKHIEFDLVLKQSANAQGYKMSKTLIESSAKNYEDSIFA